MTVGQYDAEGNLQQTVGQVTGTGTYGGQQVVFVGDKYYYMSEIMAVGRLPEVETSGGTQSGGVESEDQTTEVPEVSGDAVGDLIEEEQTDEIVHEVQETETPDDMEV